MRRLIVLRALVVVVVAVLIGRLYQLQLVDSESRRNTNSVDLLVNRYVPVTPRRGEILARDGKTLLAESVPIYNLAVMPESLPPRRSVERAQVLSEVAQIATLTSTLTISPALLLDSTPNLRVELERLSSLPPILDPGAPLTVTIAPANSMAALNLSQVFTKAVTLNNPIEDLINRDDVPRYESLLVKEDIPHELALVMHENSAHLPGVIVVEDYRRRYPLSNEVQSLSHLLGYTGRINECQLLNNNPASSWLNSLLDTVEVVDNCRLNISREIDPRLRGIPPYLNDDRIGKDGLERSYENELRGSMGRDRLMVDARERPRSERFAVQPVVNGNNLVLTIDLEFQQQTETIVRRWIAESERR
nr:peptidoglycan glycosyltransferase [Chloroflexaceae bacterium]